MAPTCQLSRATMSSPIPTFDAPHLLQELPKSKIHIVLLTILAPLQLAYSVITRKVRCNISYTPVYPPRSRRMPRLARELAMDSINSPFCLDLLKPYISRKHITDSKCRPQSPPLPSSAQHRRRPRQGRRKQLPQLPLKARRLLTVQPMVLITHLPTRSWRQES